MVSSLQERTPDCISYDTQPITWQVFLTNTADKAQRKMDKPLRVKIKDAVLSLSHNPELQGEQLSQPLTNVYSRHIKYKGKEFRVAYQIVQETNSVIILLIGPHENFYKKLKNFIYAI
ncbi:MAG: type II toxin-antitoxin system RelE/ParE family toxin [Cyanobacteria bacterium P01_H01_bin.74]